MRYLLIALLFTACSEGIFNPDDLVPDFNGIDEVISYVGAQVYTGDNKCIQSANLAQICCDKIGYDTLKADLWRDGCDIGHQICIAWTTAGKWHLFSEGQHALILSSDWRTPVNEYFDNVYNTMDVFNEHNQGVIQ